MTLIPLPHGGQGSSKPQRTDPAPSVPDKQDASGSGGDFRGGGNSPGLDDSTWFPPDPTIAVGPRLTPFTDGYIIQTVNSLIGIFQKGNVNAGPLACAPFETGDPKSAACSAAGSWDFPTGFFRNPSDNTRFIFDPKTLYDRHDNRFVVVALERSNAPFYPNLHASEMYLAVTTAAGSPTDLPDLEGDDWIKVRTPGVIRIGGADSWVDYPSIGVDDKAIYVTANLFRFSTPAVFAGLLYRIFDKRKLDARDPKPYNDIVVDAASMGAHVYASPQPVNVLGPEGATPVPYFVSSHRFDDTFLHIEGVENPLSPNPILRAVDISVPLYVLPPGRSSGLGADQLGGCDFLDVLDGRMMNAVYRGGSIYAPHVVDIDEFGGGHYVVRWYQVETNGWDATGSTPNPSLNQSGEIVPDASVCPEGQCHTFMPSITANVNKDVGIVFALSSAARYAGVYYAGRFDGDPPGVMSAPQKVAEGDACYDDSDPGPPPPPVSRWGDFFGIEMEINDDISFWGVGELPALGTTPGGVVSMWDTEIFPFAPIGNGACDVNLDIRAFDNGQNEYISVPIGVAPNDCNGAGGGNSPLVRLFPRAQYVTLSAPLWILPNPPPPPPVVLTDRLLLLYINVPGIAVNYGTSVTFQLPNVPRDAGSPVFAYAYYAPLREVKVTSEPFSGVGIRINSDPFGNGDGETDFVRYYPNGTLFTATAPPRIGEYAFVHWELDGNPTGCYGGNCNNQVSIQIFSDSVMNAVYERKLGSGTSKRNIDKKKRR